MSIDEKSIVQLLREDKQSIANLIETIGLDNVLDSLADAIDKEYILKNGIPTSHKRNQIELNFGNGDIIVYPVVLHDDIHTCICLEKVEEQYKIGEYVEGSGEKFDIKNQDVVLTFDNIKSIDVVIDALQDIKDFMIENYNQG